MRFTKKLLAVALTFALALSMAPVVVSANDNITVTIDGQSVIFADQGPIIIDGRTLVPVGGVFGALGFTPSWDSATRTATLTRSDYVVVITIDSATFTTNGESHILDIPAQIINDRTMLPIRAVLESVGYELEWEGVTRTVVITSPAVETPSAPPLTTTQPTPTLPATDDPSENEAISVSGLEQWLEVSPLVAYAAAYAVDIRNFLGMDFDVTEAAAQSSLANGWLPLDLQGQTVNTRNFPQTNIFNGFNTQTGDVFITTYSGLVLLWVDIGTSDEPGFRAYHRIFLGATPATLDVATWMTSEAEDIIKRIQEIHGLDFTVSNDIYTRQWDDGSTHWMFLGVESNLELADYEINTVENIFGTQLGDVILIIGDDFVQVLIDLGRALDFVGAENVPEWLNSNNEWVTENHRAYHRLSLDAGN